MTPTSRLVELPERIAAIVACKKARMPSGVTGLAARERARRQRDIEALELLGRMALCIAKHPEEFRAWYRLKVGFEL